MKLIITFIATLIVTAGANIVIAPSASAQTKKEAQACYKTYDGHGTGTGTDGKLTPKLQDKYKKSKCAKAKGGNCIINSSSHGAIIVCTNPDKKPSKPSGDSGDKISDPAVTCNEDDCNVVGRYINPAIRLLTVLVGVAVVIGIIWGAIEVITSAGDPQKTASGKNHIRNAVIAIIAYLLLFAFLQWIIPGGI